MPVLREAELSALLRTVEAGKSFDDRRDAAILRTFVSTGARLAEVAGVRYTPGDDATNDIDLDQGVIRVLGKGGRQRVVALDSKASRPSTATFGRGRSTLARSCPGCGSAGRAGSASPGSATWSPTADQPPRRHGADRGPATRRSRGGAASPERSDGRSAPAGERASLR